MDVKERILLWAALIASVFLLFAPAAAVILESNGMGTVSGINTTEKTITIYTESQFATSYSGSTPISEWIASDAGNVTGIVPDDSAFETFAIGDPVRYIVLGGSGGTYLGIAKMTEVSATAQITDLIGDPDRLIFSPFEGSYVLKTESVLNCAECSGTTCVASSASVTVIKSGETLAEKSLLPGGEYAYLTDDPLDYDISLKFVEGEAASDICKSTGSFGSAAGPQAVSVYEIHITPGFLPLGPGPEITESTTPAPTQSPGFGIFAFLSAAAAGAVLFIRRE